MAFELSSKTRNSALKNSETNQYTEFERSVQDDYNKLLKEYGDLKTFNFEEFARLWVKHKFSLIFNCNHKINEIGYLCEILFNCAKKFIIFSDSLNLQIGGFYLLYGLYYKQPVQHLIKIRITLNEFKCLKKLLEKMLELSQLDAIFIYNKLKEDSAFHFTYLENILGPVELLNQTELVNNIDRINFLEKLQNLSKSFFTKLDSLDKEYDQCLKQYKDESLTTIQSLPLTIQEDINNILENYKTFKDQTSEPSTSNEPVKTTLKKKAFRRKMKHSRRGRKDVTTDQ